VIKFKVYAVLLATAYSHKTLCATYFPNLRRKLLSYFSERLFLEIITEKFCV